MRRIPANVLLTIGLLAAALGYTGYTLSRTVFNADAVADSATRILEAPVVRDEITDRLVKALNVQVSDPGATTDPAQVRAAADAAVASPAFAAAFGAALRQIHAMIFAGASGSVTLDPVGVTDAVRTAAGTAAPGLAAQIPSDGLAVTITSEDVPHWHDMPRALDALTWMLLAFAAIAIVCAIVIHPDHAQALGRVGRWALVVGGLQLLIFGLLPRWGLPSLGAWGEVSAAVLEASGTTFLRAAVAITTGGAVCILISELWRSRRRTLVRKARAARL